MDSYPDLDELRNSMQKRKDEEKIQAVKQIDEQPVQDLMDSISELNTQIKELLEIFRLAAQQMKSEDTAYEKMSEQFETLIRNDQDIARGVLMTIDMLKEQKKQVPIIKEPQSILPLDETPLLSFDDEPQTVDMNKMQQINPQPRSQLAPRQSPFPQRAQMIDDNFDTPQLAPFDDKPLLDLGDGPQPPKKKF